MYMIKCWAILNSHIKFEVKFETLDFGYMFAGEISCCSTYKEWKWFKQVCWIIKKKSTIILKVYADSFARAKQTVCSFHPVHEAKLGICWPDIYRTENVQVLSSIVWKMRSILCKMSDFSLKDVIGWVPRHLLLTNSKDTCNVLIAGKASQDRAPNVSEGQESGMRSGKSSGKLCLGLWTRETALWGCRTV